jgi:hypothetical protein
MAANEPQRVQIEQPARAFHVNLSGNGNHYEQNFHVIGNAIFRGLVLFAVIIGVAIIGAAIIVAAAV